MNICLRYYTWKSITTFKATTDENDLERKPRVKIMKKGKHLRSQRVFKFVTLAYISIFKVLFIRIVFFAKQRHFASKHKLWDR